MPPRRDDDYIYVYILNNFIVFEESYFVVKLLYHMTDLYTAKLQAVPVCAFNCGSKDYLVNY